ncbi:hypothetical protein FBR01_21405 [Anaerolineae bacterium CFX8]|nr:hypothetical protein [Anaerolineae bacterium CFX8]
MIRYFRVFMLAVCAVQVVMAAAFFVQAPFAVRLWPLSYTNQMAFIFIASIFAAAAASTLWCIAAKEHAALAGIGLDYIVILVPLSVLFFQMAARTRSATATNFAIFCAVGALFGLGLFLWSRRIPARDSRPTPKFVRGAFLFFVIALLIVGGQMVLKAPNVLPWNVTTEGGIIYGWMFLGAAAYFVYGLLRPGWYNAAGQLAGFLAYDLVLIVPFLQRLPTIAPDRRWSLIIYIVVIVLSGLLAIYYLFFNPATRLWRAARLSPAVT